MHRPILPLIRRAFFTTLCAAVACLALPAPDKGPDHCPGLDSFYVGDGCNATLVSCMKRTPRPPAAVHLAAFASWIDTLSRAEPCSSRVAMLAARYATLRDTATFAVDLSDVTLVGSPSSPMTIILYVSALCPLCKRVYKGLYAEVESGSLRGVARLGIKVFSTRPWDCALLAARRAGKQSALFLSLAGVEERISMTILRRKASELGMSRKMLDSLATDSTVLREARLSASEAARNGVTVTPTVFIDGRRYRSYKDPEWIADAVLYLHEENSGSSLHTGHVREAR